MLVVKNELCVAFDVDDTLVLWNNKCYQPHKDAILIVDPADNQCLYLTPHKRHIDLMRKWKSRGYFIEVWSAAGGAWAEAVVLALGIEDVVDLITTKRMKVVDDLPKNEILGSRVYLDPDPDNEKKKIVIEETGTD